MANLLVWIINLDLKKSIGSNFFEMYKGRGPTDHDLKKSKPRENNIYITVRFRKKIGQHLIIPSPSLSCSFLRVLSGKKLVSVLVILTYQRECIH